MIIKHTIKTITTINLAEAVKLVVTVVPFDGFDYITMNDMNLYLEHGQCILSQSLVVSRRNNVIVLNLNMSPEGCVWSFSCIRGLSVCMK
jgi:hypothetical protein